MLKYIFSFLIGVFLVFSVKAERIGNFEITVQPSTKEKSEVQGRGMGWTEKEKTQILTSKICITYKGLEKIEDIRIKYIVAYKGSKKGALLVKGEEKYEKFAPLEKAEFYTKEMENSYKEFSSEWGSNQWGGKKGGCEGITLRIMKGDEILIEMNKPNEMSKYWD